MLNPFTHRKILKKGVHGRANIVSMGMFDRDAGSFNLPMTLHVYVEGWQPYEVEDQWIVKSRNAGGLSGSIPVKVDPEDQNRVAIDLRNNPEMREKLEAALGIELPPSSGAGDPAARLRQLVAMRDGGLISSEEFEAKKAEILREL